MRRPDEWVRYHHASDIRKALAEELRFNRRIYYAKLKQIQSVIHLRSRDEIMLDANELDVCLASINSIRLLVSSLKGKGLV